VRDSTKIFREAAGIFDKIKNTMIITAIMNLILSIVLGKAYGIFGVLIATTISILLTYYWYEPVLIYRSMNVNKVSEYFILQIISFILLLIGIFVTKYSTSFIKELTWASFLLKTLLCVIISNLYYLLILGHRKETKYVFHMLRRIFVRSR
jgi:peptidoglycan biosynthesis protein MviN/MurJ (putative lipid II flippase)